MPNLQENIRTTDPRKLERNPENPRLIFRADDLAALQDSINSQGILVPLTVYEAGERLVILDGERRWRCALKLGLEAVPVIVQPKPDRLQNIMMMFAIHNARRDWDPLPTAFKLRDLEDIFEADRGRRPNETELAELASMSRGEVRRLKKLLALPVEYQDELMQELEKPRQEQLLTVDHVIETQKGAAALKRRSVVDDQGEDDLRRAIIQKFRTRTITNTVAPRQLSRIGRSVERGEVSVSMAKSVVEDLINDPEYTIEDAFRDSAAEFDFQHSVEQIADRLGNQLLDHQGRGYGLSSELRTRLIELRRTIEQLLDS